MGKQIVGGALDGPLVFVDIETNGLHPINGRVIEVAAIRVERGKVTKQFRSLIDPETTIPHFISELTGITSEDLRAAPPFHMIADELMDTMEGALFVAHNVRFDYSFLKQEYKRLQKNFHPRQLCTLKLSRALFPHERSHKLGDIIARYHFSVNERHRAYDDARVLREFLQYVTKHTPPEQLERAIASQLKQPTLPNHLSPTLIKSLPSSPGVYIFEDAQGKPLYIGKSVNIRQRVVSHFNRDYAEKKEYKISQSTHHISVQQTGGELSALLLESRLVKELQPLYNRRLRKKDRILQVRASYTESGHMATTLEEVDQLNPSDLSQVLAIYPRRLQARQALRSLALQYGLCPKLMGLEKSRHSCFWYQLNKCNGACIGREAPDAYNAKVFYAFERKRLQGWPFKGPVLVKEPMKGEEEVADALIVDKWCVIRSLHQEAFCEPELQRSQQQFDLDTYKILQSFLTRPFEKGIEIREFTAAQWNALEKTI